MSGIYYFEKRYEDMASNTTDETTYEADDTSSDYEEHKLIAPQAAPRKYTIVYKNIFIIAYLHLAAAYGVYLCITSAKWQTLLFSYLCYVAATIGVTAGAHRLWSHKSYKAKFPLQVILIIFLSLAHQKATSWVRDHRLHHKHSDTDADPHNATRGFFYSHMGWLFVKKHSEVYKRGKKIDLSDLYANPIIKFQHQYASWILPTTCFGLPMLIPVIFWNETLYNSFHLTIMRVVINFHVFFLINSAAHMWGNKPYDQFILSTESNTVSLVTLGEGYHNYHHVFPWDYRCTEIRSSLFNYTRAFIDFFAWIGWAYDLKVASNEIVKKRAVRTGDGSIQ
ncbi:hypothetical protein K1T71_010646 [Dendrolimus kikuchii]|uniref:Uncharacterized protein n=1 Tax=Dendrolimus kikuchii TaxID=765133 RepID=A0ACC1CPU1_9NEOP|nr:hypothetical protein K1T71_010646 [Dendrolimus kikuchii]